MKWNISCFIVLIILCLPAYGTASNETSVLFIGNSLTSANDIPGLIAGMAQADGRSMVYASYTPGGRRFADHQRDPELEKVIRRTPWDVVVLQEQSQYPGLGTRLVNREVLVPAKMLVDFIRDNYPKTKIVFYMTMAHKDGDAYNRKHVPEVATYLGMQKRINRTYGKLGRLTSGEVAAVGEAWMEVRRKYPDLNLYADDRHPNLAGSHLAAYVLYATIFERSPIGLPHHPQIQPGQAKILQRAAAHSRR